MPVKVIVIGDTHASIFSELPSKMIKAIKEADWVIHVGDFTSINVLNSLINLINLKGKRFIGVHGNSDPLAIRNKLKAKEIVKINGRKFGITHPVRGGPRKRIEKKIVACFKNDNVDAIIFGHTHDPMLEYKYGTLLINPGKGYHEESYFGHPTSYIILDVEEDIQGKIYSIQ